MTRQLLCRGIALAAAGLVFLLLARNETGRYFGPTGFFVDVMLPRYVTLPAFLLSSAAAAAAGLWGDRVLPGTVLLVAAAAVAVAMLADRRISFSWESRELLDSYGPFGTTHRGVDSETACVEAGSWTFRIVDGNRRFTLFRGIWPLRFPAQALTSRLALAPCNGGRP